MSTNKQNLLPTASPRLIYGDKECPAWVLLDSGSQETFLRTTIANDLKIEPYGCPATMTIEVLGGQEQWKKMNRVKFKLAPFNSSDDDHVISINAWTINSVCATLYPGSWRQEMWPSKEPATCRHISKTSCIGWSGSWSQSILQVGSRRCTKRASRNTGCN